MDNGYIYIYTYIHTYISIYLYIYMYIYLYLYLYIYIHIYIYIYIIKGSYTCLHNHFYKECSVAQVNENKINILFYSKTYVKDCKYFL